MSILRQFRFIIVGIGIIFGLSACFYDDYYGTSSVSVRHSYPYYNDYYYYPGSRIYFHFSTGDYYYHNKKRWIHSRVLPPRHRLDHRDRVHIRILDDKPYTKHRQHEQTYKQRPRYRSDIKRDRRERQHHKERYEHHRKQQNIYKEEKDRKRRDR